MKKPKMLRQRRKKKQGVRFSFNFEDSVLSKKEQKHIEMKERKNLRSRSRSSKPKKQPVYKKVIDSGHDFVLVERNIPQEEFPTSWYSKFFFL